jgi:hypothetical protein
MKSTHKARKRSNEAPNYSKRPPKPDIDRGQGTHYQRNGYPKVSHLTEASALEHASGLGAMVYRCNLCGCWHVGSRPNWMSQR